MPSALVDNDGGITEEVMAKHGHSNQPESQQGARPANQRKRSEEGQACQGAAMALSHCVSKLMPLLSSPKVVHNKWEKLGSALAAGGLAVSPD
eukprot:1161831-Pelagomonas_calceolata.AAC.3